MQVPNWCNNDLEITGKPKDLHKLIKQVTTTEAEAGDEACAFDFNKVIPLPDNQKDDWYEWRIENWGTKWQPSDVTFVSSEGTTYSSVDNLEPEVWESGQVIVTFQTAWSPPIQVIKQLSKDNPNVKIVHKFYEEGNCFYGTYIYRKGRATIKEEGELTLDTPCEIYVDYMGETNHHYCQECDENFECEGEPQTICNDCQKKSEQQDKELWEETNEYQVI